MVFYFLFPLSGVFMLFYMKVWPQRSATNYNYYYVQKLYCKCKDEQNKASDSRVWSRLGRHPIPTHLESSLIVLAWAIPAGQWETQTRWREQGEMQTSDCLDFSFFFPAVHRRIRFMRRVTLTSSYWNSSSIFTRSHPPLRETQWPPSSCWTSGNFWPFHSCPSKRHRKNSKNGAFPQTACQVQWFYGGPEWTKQI